jgi:pyruvate,water dikinase
LIEADAESQFGGKAVNLGIALRAGLSVPTGFALAYDCVGRIVQNNATALIELNKAFVQMRTPIAVRSSAIGEDSENASFAGQHMTLLNITDFAQLKSAIDEIVKSASTPSALSYRAKLGIDAAPQMAVVLQELFKPEAAGVMFTRNPINSEPERVIEAAWGLGEVVVAGLVIPDYYRISPAGEILERRVGEKDIEFRLLDAGGIEEVDVPAERINARILDDDTLGKLHLMAQQCETIYGTGLDIEWGLADGKLMLLQCRSITT